MVKSISQFIALIFHPVFIVLYSYLIYFNINSIYNQSYKNFEHIIIDGGSTDKTLNILKKYNNKIDYWCSKKDKNTFTQRMS